MVSRYPWRWRLSDVPEPDPEAPTVFSTFACGGGSSMGYKRAGFRVLGNCEIDPKIAAVYKANLHPPVSYVEDIRDFVKRDDLPEALYQLDVLDGSPPCSTFSLAGDREKAWGKEKMFAEGQKKQMLDDLFFVFLEAVAKLRPKVFVAENVSGLLMGNARGYVKQIVGDAKSLGYDVQLFKLNAASMGVPQNRERVFFVANRCGYPKLSLRFCEEPIPFGDVRSKHGKRFANDDSLYKELLKHRIATDRSIADIKLRVEGKYSGMCNRLFHDDKVADTVTASGCKFRMCDGLWLSDEDIRNVSSFPQDYDFCGRSVQFICGMSVPPSMMANVAHEIKVQWLDLDS